MKKSVLTLSMVTVFLFIPMLLQAQEQSLMLGPADFVPWQNDNNVWRNSNNFYCQTGATQRYFFAPIHLPNGVRLKRVLLFFHDSGPGSVQMAVSRDNKYTGGYDYLIEATSSSGTPGDSSIMTYANWSFNLVANTGYSYSLRIVFATAGSEYKFYGAKVIYE